MTKKKAGLCRICKWGTKVCVTKIQKHNCMIKLYKTNHPPIIPKNCMIIEYYPKIIPSYIIRTSKQGEKGLECLK